MDLFILFVSFPQKRYGILFWNRGELFTPRRLLSNQENARNHKVNKFDRRQLIS